MRDMVISLQNNSFNSWFWEEYEVYFPSNKTFNATELKHYITLCNSEANFDQSTSLPKQIPASLVIKNKEKNTYILLSDLYGINPLYYAFVNEKLYVGTDLMQMYKDLNKHSFTTDSNAVFDIVMFNYPLKNKTLSNEIKRLPAGHILKQTQEGFRLISLVKPVTVFYTIKKSKKVNYSDLTERLDSFIKSKINPDLPVLLSMTGGFDSRVNFALLRKLGIPFEAYTFGNLNSNDAAPAQAICKQYGIKHHMLDLNQTFLQNKEKYFDRLIESSLGNPFILDLAHYEYVKEYFPASNIITGYMGGEVLTGGSVGVSQVTFTAMAKKLLLSNSLLELKQAFDTNFDTAFLNPDLLQTTKENYLNDLSPYIRHTGDNRNENITNFFLNEKYSKFFGVVQSVFQGKHNQIDTFMAPEYLKIVLNLPSSYTFSKPFQRTAYQNYKSRQLYAKIIKYADPSLLETRLDRGYKVGELLNYKGIIPIAYHYFLNHSGRGNKLNIRTIDYKTWFSDYIFDSLYEVRGYDDLFNFIFIRKIIDEYRAGEEAYPVSVFNKLVVIYGIILALNKIQKIHNKE